MKISYLGGAGSIGASSYLLEVQDTKLVIDCGIRFQKDRPLPDLACLNDLSLDAILVTHAHTDHTGGLAVLHQAYPSARIHMTPPTYDLVRILQKDALKIMSFEEKEAEIPLYTASQVQSMLEACSPVHIGETVEVGCVKATFLPAGHILGAAMIHLETPDGHVLFTGDYSVRGQLTVPNLELPIVPVDVLLTETTYGNRLHEDRKASEKRLISSLSRVLERGGRALIPAFAIGRAQEVLLILKRAMRNDQLAKVPVFVDGMIRPVCDVYNRHPNYVSKPLKREIDRNPHAFYDKRIQQVSNKERSKVLDSGEPCIIIASSGMLSGGASLHYAQKMVGNEKDAIFITGYQDEESPGRRLLDLAKNGGKGKISLAGKEYSVKCEFGSYSLSAHADKSEILGLVEKFNPKIVSLIHGDLPAKKSLKASITHSQVVFADEGESLDATFKPRKVTWDRKAKNIESMPTSVADASEYEDSDSVELRWPNAKGSLLEYCKIAEGVGEPKFLTRKAGGFYSTTIVLMKDGAAINLDSFRAKDEKRAEALACQALLYGLIDVNIETKDADGVVLTEQNPKGMFLESCARSSLKPPIFEKFVHPKGFVGRLIFDNKETEVRTPYFVSSQSKLVERVCYQVLLEISNFSDLSSNPSSKLETTQVAGVKITPQASGHPKSFLNEMKQQQRIEDFGFEWLDQVTDGMQPSFKVRGWLKSRGQVLETYPVVASSKKRATLLASQSLVDRFNGRTS